MAKPEKTIAPDENTASKKAPKVKLSPDLRKQSATLLEIGRLYFEAAKALRGDDDIAYNRAIELINQYQNLFDTLAKKVSDDITREGLAAVSEM